MNSAPPNLTTGPNRPSPPGGPLDPLVTRLLEEMTTAWQQGQRPLAEDFLARHPELARSTEDAVRLVYEETCLRQEHGEEQAHLEVLRRFPQWRNELEVLLACHHLLQGPELAGPAFPEAGETLGGLHLLCELGRGTQGRVFLASQPDLADRPVVVKMTACAGQEHLTLARLQHTHIVPLYGIHDFPERNLRVLCMPYLGGRPLRQVLDALADRRLAERTGLALVRCLGHDQPGAVPARRLLGQLTYVQAICWIGWCLADALQYAHERGLVHLDLKPSNVLLAADGQPLLLDFHLAREPLREGTAVPDWLGGTPEYMSPEQVLALEAVRQRRPVPRTVDARSDIYSLGLLLYEALGGKIVDPDQELPPLHRENPAVGRGLSSLVHKCLAPEPAQRYGTARAVADDLWRHLRDEPLRGVPEHSLGERWRKWRRRRPHDLVLAGMLTAVLGVVLGASIHGWNTYHQREEAVETALRDGRQQLEQQQYNEAVATLGRGLETTRDDNLAQELRKCLQQAKTARAGRDLHQLAERLRFQFDSQTLSAAERHSLDALCRGVWQQRALICRYRDVDPQAGERITADLLDLALFWANLQPPHAPEAVQILDEAEVLCGSSPALLQERQAHAGTGPAPALLPRTAWEHYTLGRFRLRAGDLEAAAGELGQAVDQQPDGFWPRFHQGVCLYRLQRYEAAARAFEVCVALSPGTARCYYNLALAEAARGETEIALRDYQRALARDPRLAEAALNRALLLLRAKRCDEALLDLQRAFAGGADPATVYYTRALVHEARHDRPAAQASLEQALRINSGLNEARALEERLRRGPR